MFGGYLTIRTTRKEVEIARLKSEFVSTVSHEFRSPLTGIRQLAGLLRDGRVKDDDRRSEYYEMICRESDRLSRLVENLLDFSRMEEGRKEYRFERLATGVWLRALVDEFVSEAAFPDVTIETSLADDLPDLTGDAGALTVAIHNLLDNAVKYSPGTRAIRLEAEAANGRILIRVRDRGVGIPESEQPHVFDKFYRGGNASAAGVKGAGLGLALVREIVRAHGGSVALQSRPGEGSTFTLDLSAAKPGPVLSGPDGKERVS
jgi:signal transduction histidine kinase